MEPRAGGLGRGGGGWTLRFCPTWHFLPEAFSEVPGEDRAGWVARRGDRDQVVSQGWGWRAALGMTSPLLTRRERAGRIAWPRIPPQLALQPGWEAAGPGCDAGPWQGPRKGSCACTALPT